MATVFRSELFHNSIDKRGVFINRQKGETVDVEGVEMVRLSGGVIVSAAGWHTTMQEADAAVADELDALVLTISSQAARLREGVHAATTV